MTKLNKMLLVWSIVAILALTACGKSDERFYSTTSVPDEVSSTPASETPVTSNNPSKVAEVSSSNIIIELPSEHAEDVIEALSEVASLNEATIAETEDVVTIVVPIVTQPEVIEDIIKVVLPIVDHCNDSKGKDGIKNKHCR